MESVRYSDYYRPARRESKIIPGLTVTDCEHGILTCPRCGKEQADIEHGATRQCSCGLKMTVWGNALYISL